MRIVCDIDGVLADVRKHVEEHLLEKNDWKTYFEHTLEFPVIPTIRSLLYTLDGKPHHETYLVTGRPESNRVLTELWLQSVGIGPGVFLRHLLMRASGDSRPTWDVKMDIIRRLNPDLIIDDDPAVIEVAVKEGFTVLQVHGFRCTSNDYVPFKKVE